MLKTLHKAVGLLVCVAWYNLASAANMGAINVTSALGHPLKAEIALVELGKNDKTSLTAKLASVEEFKNAGIDYPYSLPKLIFEVATGSNGQPFIKLTSAQPVNEPFVSLLIELSWSSGKLLREYTFLLDPANFVPEQPKVAEVKPVEPVLPVPAVVPEVMPEAVPAVVPAEPVVAAAPEAEPIKDATIAAAPASNDEAKAEVAPVEQGLAEPAKVEATEPVKVEPLEPATPAKVVTESILVEKGDTLGKIADAVKPVDVSLERMLVAMYRANVQTFDGKNMNRIKAGKILRMPETSEIEKVTQKAAVKEIRAQVADWQDYRQKLAAVLPVSDDKAPKQETGGKISTAVAEKAPVIKESAKEVLKLSKGESLGDKVVTGAGTKSKNDKVAADADDTAAKNKQALEEQKKIAKLENINKDASKLVELKAAPVVPAAPSAEKKPEAKKPVTAPPAPATSSSEFDVMALVNEYWAILTEDMLVLGGGVAVLLGLGGLGFVMMRRGKGVQKKSSPKTEDVGAATGSWRTPVAPSPDTGDFTQTTVSAAPMTVAAALDDVDPISEADLFLNFGRDAQAEEILKEALTKTPSNLQVKLKLLSIYVSRKDSKTFSKYAQEIKESGDAAAWERAAVMGQEVDPGNPMYGGVKGEVRNREVQKAEVDFDLGLNKAAPQPAGEDSIKDFKMDFDVGAAQTVMNARTLEASGQFGGSTSSSVKARASADVDATSILSRDVVNAAQAATPMDFDVSGILPGEAKKIADTSSMDFDLSGKDMESTAVLSKPVVDVEPPSSDMNFNDLVFDIPPARPKPAEKQPEPIKGGLAFALDIPTPSETPSSGNKLGDAVKMDMDFGNININLDEEPIARAGGEGKSEQWNEVATKLDLAKAYQEMGDADGAREILEEVLKDGDDAQKETAEKLLQQITV